MDIYFYFNFLAKKYILLLLPLFLFEFWKNFFCYFLITLHYCSNFKIDLRNRFYDSPVHITHTHVSYFPLGMAKWVGPLKKTQDELLISTR